MNNSEYEAEDKAVQREIVDPFNTDILTVTEALAFLRISRATLYKLIKVGSIPVFRYEEKKSAKIYFRKSVLLDWIIKKESELSSVQGIGESTLGETQYLDATPSNVE